MLANLFFSSRYRPLRKGYPDPPSQDSIPLPQLGQAPTLQDRIIQGSPAFEAVFREVETNPDNGKRRASNHWRLLCYFLHAFLVALHLILLVVAASDHAERQVIVQADKVETLTTSLSAGLQAFYTVYTALLVFVTQRLMLSAIFSTPKKLTQIHDICDAWGGVGAALSALWQQIKVASSVASIVVVAVYFACISVLHITSSTLIQIQMTDGHPTGGMTSVLRTWPDASVDFASLDWMEMAPLVPFLQEIFLYGTVGLANNTLYDDIGVDDFLTVTVDAMTLNANCGILANLSVGASEGSVWNVNSSMSGLDPIGITVSYPPLLNEVWLSPFIQCSETICSDFILFLVSAEMDVDDSVHGVDHVYINGTYYSPGGTTQNFSTPVYFAACSLDVTNNTITLDSSGHLLSSGKQATDVKWSAFSPAGDLNLTSAISYAMKSANSLPPSPYCQPIMSYPELWANMTAFNAYVRSTLGMVVSPCSGTPIVQYASSPYLLTRDRMESTVSQIAAEFIWIAGQLGEAGGGFDPQVLGYQIAGTMELWSLNINPLPVIFALSASVILLILVLCVLWRHPPAMVSGAGMLEIMWFGSRSPVLRDHLSIVETALLDSLRASAMSETVFWSHLEHRHEGSGDLSAVVSFYDVKTNTEGSRSLGLLGSENQRPSEPSRRRPMRTWCYTLHVVLVALHVALLALLVHHPEQSVVILSDSKTMTIGLSVILQTVYTLYSALLVLLMQRLALFKIASERRKLTAVHDVSGAWTGIGAAINILWQQRKGSSSTREIIPVAAYLTMMLVLHITSSSIMQWQEYRDMTPVGINVQTNLVMPDSAVNISQLRWAEIFPIVRLAQVLVQDVDLSTYGLLNSTIYDVAAQISNIAPWGTALVNATTITAQCGLVSNLALSSKNSEGKYQISFQNGTNNGSFLESPIWKDVVQAIAPTTECAACPQTLFYLITTGIDVEEPLHDAAVAELNWTYTPSDGNAQDSTTLTYIAACSLNTRTVLIPPNDVWAHQTSPSTSAFWSVWSPENATSVSVGMATALSTAASVSFPVFFQGNTSADFTDMDSYIMSSLGLNLTYANETSVSQSSANSSVTLSPGQLENAIAQTAAAFLWTAGQLGESGGGFQRSMGATQGWYDALPVWRLHLNTVPVIFASIASFLSLILATIIIGKGPSKKHPMSISGTRVLECLWLEAHSELLHSHLQTVEEPRLDTLRAAGMFEICLGDIGRSSYPEAEQ